MYGKVFASMFEGSMYGNPDAIITLMVMLALCDAEGCVDITPEAIAARTSIPLETIRRGIEYLGQPDARSRTEGHEGRRIICLDNHRDWGWRLVNYAKYRAIQSAEDRRVYWRNYKREKRAVTRRGATASRVASKDSTSSPQVSTLSTNAEADAEAKGRALRSSEAVSQPSASSLGEPRTIKSDRRTGKMRSVGEILGRG